MPRRAGPGVVVKKRTLGFEMLHKIYQDHEGRPLKSWAAACAVMWFVFIRKGKENDKGLLAHELDHVKQFWGNPLHVFQYLWSWRYRLRCEVEAYQTQLKVTLEQYPQKSREALVTLFAGFIATRYKLPVMERRVLELMRVKDIWKIDL